MGRNLSWRKVIGIAFLSVAVAFGGSKPQQIARFVFNLGLTDAGSTFNSDTNVATAKWRHTPAIADYDFKWQVKVGDGEWIELPSAKVIDGQATAHIERTGDETVLIQCYPEYVPPPQVVTNGVYHLNGVMRSMDTVQSVNPKFVTPGIPIKAGDDVLNPTRKPPETTINASEETHE